MKEYIAHEAAGRLGVSVAALRYYEKAGLLPQIRRNEAGGRVYSERDMEWLYMIVLMREAGLPIEEIRRYTALLLEGPDTMRQRYTLVAHYQQDMQERIEKMQAALGWLETKAAVYEEALAAGKVFESFEEEAAVVRKRMGLPATVAESEV